MLPQPYESLANFLMTAQSRSDYPVVKRWFDRFRFAQTDLNDGNLQEQAKNQRCTIIRNNMCYFNNGIIESCYCGQPVNVIKTFLLAWQEFAEQRDQPIKLQAEKCATDKLVTTKLKDLKDLDELLLNAKTIFMYFSFYLTADRVCIRSNFQFIRSDSLAKCELGMTNLLNIEQFLNEATDFKMETEIQIKVNQEKNKLLNVKPS